MTHTQTVRVLLDATNRRGVLYHGLTDSECERVKRIARRYMRAHALGLVAERVAAESDLLDALAVARSQAG